MCVARLTADASRCHISYTCATEASAGPDNFSRSPGHIERPPQQRRQRQVVVLRGGQATASGTLRSGKANIRLPRVKQPQTGGAGIRPATERLAPGSGTGHDMGPAKWAWLQNQPLRPAGPEKRSVLSAHGITAGPESPPTHFAAVSMNHTGTPTGAAHRRHWVTPPRRCGPARSASCAFPLRSVAQLCLSRSPTAAPVGSAPAR